MTNNSEDFDNLKNNLELTNVVSTLIPKDFGKKFKALKKAQDKLAKIENDVKAKLIELFENVEDLENNTVTVDGIKFTYVKSYKKNTIDSKKLQEEEPDVYKKYLKQSNVKSSIKISVDY